VVKNGHTAAKLPPIRAWAESKANDKKLKRAIVIRPTSGGKRKGRREKREEKKVKKK
jgi:hypothetical protein